MTEKELLYIEDLLGAEKLAQKVCECHSKTIKDAELKAHFTSLAEKHKQNLVKLSNLLN